MSANSRLLKPLLIKFCFNSSETQTIYLATVIFKYKHRHLWENKDISEVSGRIWTLFIWIKSSKIAGVKVYPTQNQANRAHAVTACIGQWHHGAMHAVCACIGLWHYTYCMGSNTDTHPIWQLLSLSTSIDTYEKTKKYLKSVAGYEPFLFGWRAPK